MFRVYKSVVLFYLLFLYTDLAISEDVKFTYTDPPSWGNDFPLCGESRQSPINFAPDRIKPGNYPCPTLQYLNYDTDPTSMKIVNTGNGISIISEYSETPKIVIQNDLAPGTYKLVSINLHWAEAPGNGSEHAISGIKYAAEGHAYHMNTKYDSFETASDYSDGILVVANLYTQNNNEESGLAPIVDYLPQVREVETSVDASPVSPTKLGYICQDYLTYVGSLPEPPCSEDVTWIVCFKSPISVTRKHLEVLRETNLYDGVTNNIRETQNNDNRIKLVDCSKRSNPRRSRKQ